MKGEIDETRQQLDPALRELTWAEDDLWDYIQSTRDLVKVPMYSKNIFLNALSMKNKYNSLLMSGSLSLLILMAIVTNNKNI